MRFNQKRKTNAGFILQQRVLKTQICQDIADIPTIH